MNFKILTFFALIVLISQTILAVPRSNLRLFMPRSNLASLANDQILLDAPLDYQDMLAQDLEDEYLLQPEDGKLSIHLPSFYQI
jgi:hypothetical protein